MSENTHQRRFEHWMKNLCDVSMFRNQTSEMKEIVNVIKILLLRDAGLINNTLVWDTGESRQGNGGWCWSVRVIAAESKLVLISSARWPNSHQPVRQSGGSSEAWSVVLSHFLAQVPPRHVSGVQRCSVYNDWNLHLCKYSTLSTMSVNKTFSNRWFGWRRTPAPKLPVSENHWTQKSIWCCLPVSGWAAAQVRWALRV